MKRLLTILAVLLLIAGAGIGVYAWQQQDIDSLKDDVANLRTQLNDKSKQTQTQVTQTTDSQTFTSKKGVKIKVYYPSSGAKLTSPTVIMGEVPGNWSFEASFPVQLTDSKGAVVATGHADLLGDWMTEQMVPFTAKLTYTAAAAGSGTLTLSKDNPSGLEANNDSVTIPVTL